MCHCQRCSDVTSHPHIGCLTTLLDDIDVAQTERVCRGAAEGEGLGNAFLSHIQAVDGIFHVCRGFEDPEVTHVEDRVDPVEDLEIIHKYVRPCDIFSSVCMLPMATVMDDDLHVNCLDMMRLFRLCTHDEHLVLEVFGMNTWYEHMAHLYSLVGWLKM